MSWLVTGELTKNLANKKLKIRDVEPSGATYSTHNQPHSNASIDLYSPARMYSSASVLPIS